METVEGFQTIIDLDSAAVGELDGQLVALVRDPSREGWRELRKALVDHGFDLDKLRMRQAGWFGDGAELWLLETA